MLRQSAEPFPGPSCTSEKTLRPCICVHPARVEQEEIVRGNDGEMQQLEENKPNPQTPFC